MHMKLHFSLIIVYLLACCGSLETKDQIKISEELNRIVPFSIDSSFCKEVNEHVVHMSDHPMYRTFQLPDTSSNRMNLTDLFFCFAKPEIQLFENDSLMLDTYGKTKESQMKVMHFWKGDTLKIIGGLGLFSNLGFVIKIVQGQGITSGYFSSDTPIYKLNKDDSLDFSVTVPCKTASAKISLIPAKGSNQKICGYVQFESQEFYEVDGGITENQKLNKCRVNMKTYFISTYFPLE